jgi:hypothetical protein
MSFDRQLILSNHHGDEGRGGCAFNMNPERLVESLRAAVNRAPGGMARQFTDLLREMEAGNWRFLHGALHDPRVHLTLETRGKTYHLRLGRFIVEIV